MSQTPKPALDRPTEHHFFSVDEIRKMLLRETQGSRSTLYPSHSSFVAQFEYVQHVDPSKSFIRLTLAESPGNRTQK